jgi:hypothetical protein
VLAGFGLQTVESNAARRTVVVVGTAAAANAAFNVDLARYTAGANTYRGHEGPVHVPAEIEGLVEGVFGLDDRPQATSHFVRGADLSGRVVTPRATQALTALDAAQPTSFLPSPDRDRQSASSDWAADSSPATTAAISLH